MIEHRPTASPTITGHSTDVALRHALTCAHPAGVPRASRTELELDSVINYAPPVPGDAPRGRTSDGLPYRKALRIPALRRRSGALCRPRICLSYPIAGAFRKDLTRYPQRGDEDVRETGHTGAERRRTYERFGRPRTGNRAGGARVQHAPSCPGRRGARKPGGRSPRNRRRARSAARPRRGRGGACERVRRRAHPER